MPTQSLLITALPDGTYHVKETGDGALDQSMPSPDAVLDLVQQFLGGAGDSDAGPGDDPGDGASADASDPSAAGDDSDPTSGAPSDPSAMKAAWSQEAATRDPSSGLRK